MSSKFVHHIYVEGCHMYMYIVHHICLRCTRKVNWLQF